MYQWATLTNGEKMTTGGLPRWATGFPPLPTPPLQPSLSQQALLHTHTERKGTTGQALERGILTHHSATGVTQNSDDSA